MSDKVQIDNLLYTYGSLIAVDIGTLQIEKGDLYGIIGADGAGKTSLFRLLASLYKPKQGKINVFGYDTIKDYSMIRAITGYMPSKFSLYEDLTIKENIKFFASIFETSFTENYSLIEDIYQMLRPFENRQAGKLSGGMKQKLALCSALIHKPKLLLLDEPTTGVDPASRKEFWDILIKLQANGITIIVSTPYLDEAQMCNKIALMHRSKIIVKGATNDLIAKFPRNIFHIKSINMRQLLQYLRQYPFCNYAYSFGDTIHYQDIRDENEDEIKIEIMNYLRNLGQVDISVKKQAPTIEDVFIDNLQGQSYDN